MKLQMSPPTIAVVLPCFNEALAVRQVLDEFKEHLPAAALHVFDNRSTDDTARVARDAGAKVTHVQLRGKGNVVRRMFADAREGARSTEREAPTQSCVFSPTSDERSAAGCRRRCGGSSDQGCFGPCAIQAAIRINSARPGCGTSF